MASKWFDDQKNVIKVLSSRPVEPPPRQETPSAQWLAELLAIRATYQVDPSLPRPNHTAAERFAAKTVHNNAFEPLKEKVWEILNAIDQEIARLLKAGIPDNSLIRTSDFGKWFYIDTMKAAMPDQEWLVVGVLDSLPAEHRLRTLLPVQEQYTADHENAFHQCLILGRPEAVIIGRGQPKDWYTVQECLDWTRRFRNHQKSLVQQAEDQLERDRVARLLEIMKSEAYTHYKKTQIACDHQEKGDFAEVDAYLENQKKKSSDPNQPITTIPPDWESKSERLKNYQSIPERQEAARQERERQIAEQERKIKEREHNRTGHDLDDK